MATSSEPIMACLITWFTSCATSPIVSGRSEKVKKLQERLHRAEKMEVLGTLAGGVAHDLNNVLGYVRHSAGFRWSEFFVIHSRSVNWWETQIGFLHLLYFVPA